MSRTTFDVEAVLRDDGWIRGLARGLLRDASDADDALQEARLALLRSPPPRLDDPRPWLARVALNFLRKRRREETRRQHRERRAARPEPLRASPQEALERVEVRRQVLEAVLALEEPYRATLVQRYFEELGVREIAAAAGVPAATVRTRLGRALAMLRGRLEVRLGAKGAWAVLLLPFLAPELRAAGTALSSSGTGSLCIQGGVIGMSSKGIAVAVGVSGLLVLGAFVLVERSLVKEQPLAANDPGTSASRAGTREAARAAEAGPVGAGDEASGAGASSRDPVRLAAVAGDAAGSADADGDDVARPPALPASAEALAFREAYRALKGKFGDGGRTGWRAVGMDIARIQELLVSGPEGLDELLALLDEETDSGFLEAVLHHLPLAKSDHRQGILDHLELRQELWGRFEETQDPERRAAFLRFFAYERSLSAAHMHDFLTLAGAEPEARVRQVAVDAIASHRDLLPQTWEVLARAYEQDPSPQCREDALQGLALVEADGARALMRAAFTSPDERLRAAAIASAAGEHPPDEVTGGDAPAYLVAELRGARTPGYKMAILKRLVGDPRPIYEEAIRQELAREADMGLEKSYREALEAIEESRSARTK